MRSDQISPTEGIGYTFGHNPLIKGVDQVEYLAIDRWLKLYHPMDKQLLINDIYWELAYLAIDKKSSLDSVFDGHVFALPAGRRYNHSS